MIKIRYSIEPRDSIYVKGYEFLSFAKTIGKNLCNKYSQKLLDSATQATKVAKKSATDAKATGDLSGNKISDKITVFQKII